MKARSDGEPVPSSFQEVEKSIGEAAAKIAGSDANPVWIVNGDKEVAEHNIDFGARSIWKILVGGTKLSRGFTIEGLTVSYYVRLTAQADTSDADGTMVRTSDPGTAIWSASTSDAPRPARGKPTRDIYDAFEAACRSEEMFRDEIRGTRSCRRQTPGNASRDSPARRSTVPWLKPAAADKMYNAVLVERRSPGARIEPTGYPSKPTDVAHNAIAMKALLEAANAKTTFLMSSARPFEAFYGIVSHAELISALRELRWAPEDHFAADFRWLEGLSAGQINAWIIMLPQLAGESSSRSIFGLNRSVHERSRREGRVLFSGIADPKHRLSADRLASNAPANDDVEAAKLQASNRERFLFIRSST